MSKIVLYSFHDPVRILKPYKMVSKNKENFSVKGGLEEAGNREKFYRGEPTEDSAYIR